MPYPPCLLSERVNSLILKIVSEENLLVIDVEAIAMD